MTMSLLLFVCVGFVIIQIGLQVLLMFLHRRDHGGYNFKDWV